MLDGAIGIEQASADRSDLRADGVADHLPQPVAIDHFEVVVQQRENTAVRFLYGDVVDARVVERVVIVDDPHTLVAQQFLEVRLRLRFLALIVDDDDFEVGVVGFVEDPVHALTQDIHTVLGRNDDADQRFDWQRVDHPVDGQVRVLRGDLGIDLHAL
ncbi:hypothetical protein D3C78_1105140 [compost metagenome]